MILILRSEAPPPDPGWRSSQIQSADCCFSWFWTLGWEQIQKASSSALAAGRKPVELHGSSERNPELSSACPCDWLSACSDEGREAERLYRKHLMGIVIRAIKHLCPTSTPPLEIWLWAAVISALNWTSWPLVALRKATFMHKFHVERSSSCFIFSREKAEVFLQKFVQVSFWHEQQWENRLWRTEDGGTAALMLCPWFQLNGSSSQHASALFNTILCIQTVCHTRRRNMEQTPRRVDVLEKNRQKTQQRWALRSREVQEEPSSLNTIHSLRSWTGFSELIHTSTSMFERCSSVLLKVC